MSTVLRGRNVPLPLCVAVTIGAVVIGFLAGFGIRRTPVSEPSVPWKTPAPSVSARTSEGAVTAGDLEYAPLPEDREELKKLVMEQEVEIRRLRGHPSSDPHAQQMDLAKRIWGAFEKMEQDRDDMEARSEVLKIWSQIGDLGEEAGPFFVERYRVATDEKLKQGALGLACSCGGPEVNALMRDVLRDPSLSNEDRTRVLSVFLQADDISSLKGKPTVIDDELAAVASRFLASADSTERAGAAGLLGGHNSPETRARLRQLADTDSDVMVQITAIKALSWIGDPLTLAYLRALPILPSEQGLNTYENAVKRAIRRLEKKYSQ